VAEVVGVADVDSLLLAEGVPESLGSVLPVGEVESDGVAEVVSVGVGDVDSLTLSVGVGDAESSANAAGADSRASGAMTAVAAAAAMARRSFMKSSRSPVYCGSAAP
jgi:hypothetical protein